ncbi:MAG: DUF4132 domain-containing protein [Synechococcus sp.]
MTASEQRVNSESHAEFIQAIVDECRELTFQTYHLKNSQIGATILKLSRAEQAALAIAMLRWSRGGGLQSTKLNRYLSDRVLEAMFAILKRKLPFTAEEVVEFLEALQVERQSWWMGVAPIKNLVRNYLKDNPLAPELRDKIAQTCNSLDRWYYERKHITELRRLISSYQETLAIQPGEAWSDRAIAQLKALSEDQRSPWLHLLEECAGTSGGKPSAKWLKAAKPHRQTIGLDSFQQSMLEWFPLVDRPRTQPLNDWRGDRDFLHDQNADILKGLVWLCADLAEVDVARALNKLAVSSYRKIPGIGPRCIKLGNACVWALGQMPTREAIAQLALLKVKVKFGTAQKGIEKALTAAAEREELPREEIEELAVPSYGLAEVGIRREPLGDFTAELVVTGTSSTMLRWIKPDGKLQKSVPKAVKDHYADALKELKLAAQDIQKMLPAQRDRIESLYLQQKTWDFATWQQRYLNHPLVGTLARRMLWQFESSGESEALHHAVGIWLDGQLVNLNSQPIDWLNNSTQVRLWHPIAAAPQSIQAWRNWLLEREIQQPFKQAHREIYLLTPAEETTRVYSNRFAAHILKQHQFNALCRQRGWKNQLRLMVDDCYLPARLLLPSWGLRAEFWIEGIGDQYGIDTNDTGTYLYLSTDQVRFYPTDSAENYAQAGCGDYSSSLYGDRNSEPSPVPLEEIPALVFSEVMRDVDLFVGVASVGNDPNWADGGPEGRHVNYWQSYSFGELSVTAQTRRQVLETLVPKLKKIRDRCSFQDRFLVVKGDIRTYRIHLGSSNILMEPNDQYLCIVSKAGVSATNKLFLPFEGDKTLAVILSKAFLLADDTRIKDRAILNQIEL